ncbi:hypothetical protein [Candidatus Nitrosocosmicus sp. FF01]|uniref:hypothetical protein n=1 Tax=Candidatus Nitrosocosmicus sp. FF01 TaxID=3397670 RepID=UPI0039ED69AF
MATLQNKASANHNPANQNSQVVSGGDTIGSGNNVNVQSQTNSGSNAAAQS